MFSYFNSSSLLTRNSFQQPQLMSKHHPQLYEEEEDSDSDFAFGEFMPLTTLSSAKSSCSPSSSSLHHIFGGGFGTFSSLIHLSLSFIFNFPYMNSKFSGACTIYAGADVILWRRKEAAASTLIGVVSAWLVFHVWQYTLLSLLSTVFLLLISILYLWAKAAQLLNRFFNTSSIQ